MAMDSTLQFLAVGTYSDTSSKNITALVVWQSSQSTIAMFGNTNSSNGIVTALSAGSTNISASYQAVMQSTTLTISPAPTVVTAANSIGISCSELTTLLGGLNAGVVNPTSAINGSNYSNP